MIDVKFDSKKVDKVLAKLAGRLERPSRFLRTWGQSVAREARENARKKGGRNFWREVAQSTRLREVTNDSALVVSDHPAAAHKELGGEIRPKNAKALTIPIADEAKGKTAGEFEAGGRELFTIPGTSPDTKGILGFSENGEFHPLFVLRTKVVQDPDPWWPTDQQISDMGIREAGFWIEKELSEVSA